MVICKSMGNYSCVDYVGVIRSISVILFRIFVNILVSRLKGGNV